MSLVQLWSAQRAFLRLGWLELVGYPAAFVLGQLNLASSLLLYLFLGRLIVDTAALGHDYYTFVVIGSLVHGILNVGLTGFSTQMDSAIQQGRLEALLVQPVSWNMLPFGMVQFQTLTRVATMVGMMLLSIVFGARFLVGGLLPAALLLALGFISVMAIGILGTAIKVLTKRANPVLMIYSILAALVSGVWFPIDVLPGWLRPLSWITPQTYILSGIRHLLMADSADIAGPSLATAFIALLIFCALAYPLAFSVYRRTMNVGRELGILAGY